MPSPEIVWNRFEPESVRFEEREREHRFLETMKRLVLVSLIVLISGARGRSFLTPETFVEHGNEDVASFDSAGDVGFSSDVDENAEKNESNHSRGLNSVDFFPQYSDEKRDWELNVANHENEHSNDFKEDLVGNEPSQASAPQELTAADKRISASLSSVDFFDDPQENFPSDDPEFTSPLMRRGINNWQGSEESIEPGNVPWNSLGSYPGHDDDPYRQNYFDKSSYPESFHRVKNYSYSSGYENLKEVQYESEIPRYIQKNYYNNFYVVIPDGKPTTWSTESADSDNKSRGNLRGQKPMRKNDCKHYVQFLKHIFQRSEEEPYLYYDESEQGDNESAEQAKTLGQRPFQTHLLGPTLYIDNSGKASQSNVYGNGLQTIDGPLSGSKFTSVPFNDFRLHPTAVVDKDWKTLFSSRERNFESTISDDFRFSSTEASPATEEPTTSSQPIQENVNKGFESYGPEILKRFGGEAFPTSDAPAIAETYSTENFSEKPRTTTTEKTGDDPLMSIVVGHPGLRPPPKWLTQVDLQRTTLSLQNETWMLRKGPEAVHGGGAIDVARNKPDADCNDKMLPCPDTVNVTYPLNGYCNRYVTCESGRAIRRLCTDGLHFNPITKSCDLPHNSICTYACPEPNGIYGIPGDCGGYFVCKNSILEYRMCPPKMHWDARKDKCVFEELSDCPMKCAGGNQIKGYEGDCKGYIICLHGTPYYHKCPPNMAFDQMSETCVPEHLSNCRNDPRLLVKTLNPNVLCKNIMKKFGTKTWCDYFSTEENAPGFE